MEAVNLHDVVHCTQVHGHAVIRVSSAFRDTADIACAVARFQGPLRGVVSLAALPQPALFERLHTRAEGFSHIQQVSRNTRDACYGRDNVARNVVLDVVFGQERGLLGVLFLQLVGYVCSDDVDMHHCAFFLRHDLSVLQTAKSGARWGEARYLDKRHHLNYFRGITV